MIFKNAFVPKSLSTSFERVLKKNPTLLNVIILKYREEFIYGYNFMKFNTVKEKLFLYSKDFLRAKQKPRNCTEYSEDSENMQKIPNIA